MKRFYVIAILAMLLVSGLAFAPTTTTEQVPVSSGGSAGQAACERLYWFDGTSTTCGLKEFCGAYMYYGLYTFTDKEECYRKFDSVHGVQEEEIVEDIIMEESTASGGGSSYGIGVCSGSYDACTMEYAPVCATIESYQTGGFLHRYQKTFSNKCSACAFSTRTNLVTGIQAGECEVGVECPLIARPAPDYCSNGKIVPKYKEYNGQRCLVGYDCQQATIEPVEERAIFMYIETNGSIGREKVFSLYSNGLMTEKITNRLNNEAQKLVGEINIEEAKEFIASLHDKGFFKLGQLRDCTNTPAATGNAEELVACPVGASNHTMYASYLEENKVSWYANLFESYDSIDYALEKVKEFEAKLEGTPEQNEKYVSLGKDFYLTLAETAKVRETGLKLKLERIDLEDNSATISFMPLYNTAQNETETTVEFAGENGSVQTAVVTTASAPGLLHSWVKIKVGEREMVSGHVIYLNDLMVPKCSSDASDSGEVLTKCVGGKPMASMKVTKADSPDYITAILGKKFEIQAGQTAKVHDEQRNPVMNFSLEGIAVPRCRTDVKPECKTDSATGIEVCEKIWCDARPIANVYYTELDRTYPANTTVALNRISIREGETKTQGRFSFYFADYENGRAVFAVKKIADIDEVQLVRLEEPFKLGLQETALIVNKDIFITLQRVYSGGLIPQPEPDAPLDPVQRLCARADIDWVSACKNGEIAVVVNNLGGGTNFYKKENLGEPFLKCPVVSLDAMSEECKKRFSDESYCRQTNQCEDMAPEEEQEIQVVEIEEEVVDLAENEPIACTEEAKICPDGVTVVARDPNNNCQFKPCPVEQMVCTMDAKVCPDGLTTVGRDPNNNCEFRPCPSTGRGHVIVSVWRKSDGGLVPVTEEAVQKVESVRERIMTAEASGMTIRSQEENRVGGTTIMPYRKTYTLQEGQTLKIYDIQLSLQGTDGRTAKFLASGIGFGNTIHAQVGEPFKLEDGMAANLAEANMRIDLLGIESLTYCTESEIKGGAENVPPSYCGEERYAKIGVSKLLLEEIGRKVQEKMISQNVRAQIYEAGETAVSSDGTIQPFPEIDIPPMPFRTFRMKAGESVSVGDFEIHALAIWNDTAEFIVKDKSTGLKFKLVIAKGWNLFSIPGEIRAIGQSSCKTPEFRLFKHNRAQNKFDKVLDPKNGKAYWLYNAGEECVVEAELEKPVTIFEIDELYEGWNFVPVVKSMIGKKIGEMGNCEIRGAFLFDTANQNWANMTNTVISEAHLGLGFAVKSANKCSLIVEEEVPDLPGFPELPEVE